MSSLIPTLDMDDILNCFKTGVRRATREEEVRVWVSQCIEGGTYVPVEDFTYVPPKPMRDSALIDRIHGVVPGWVLPKIRQAKHHLSQGYGIVLDYFSEVLHVMRKESLVGEVSKHVELSGNITIRDERAVKKMVSAYMKLLFSNLEFDKRELEVVVRHVVDLRQRVREWLHKLSPGEFPKERITYAVRD
ncbi:MAG: BREX system Lon protease-like protein BrxL [Zestosphaera sp.]